MATLADEATQLSDAGRADGDGNDRGGHAGDEQRQRQRQAALHPQEATTVTMVTIPGEIGAEGLAGSLRMRCRTDMRHPWSVPVWQASRRGVVTCARKPAVRTAEQSLTLADGGR